MDIQENITLAPYTTFYIGGPARYFCVANTIPEIITAAHFTRKQNVPILVLSGGSNMLVSDQGFPGLVLQLNFKGVEVVHETNEECVLKIATGEVWDDIVKYAVERDYWGIENLSHIPGRVGAFAVQNVGAYGQEAKEIIVSVDALNLQTGTLETLSNDECKFGYRESIFNTARKNHFAILYVRLRLSKLAKRNLAYADVAKYFEGKSNPALSEIREAIIAIRDKKFPYPDRPEKGNAGSCFKNPILSADDYSKFKEKIVQTFPEVVERLFVYESRADTLGNVKVPAAFLLDICGMKGLEYGGAKINPAQPLVIVNATGHATARDVLEIIQMVRGTVHLKTGVILSIEPELIGFSEQELHEFVAL